MNSSAACAEMRSKHFVRFVSCGSAAGQEAPTLEPGREFWSLAKKGKKKQKKQDLHRGGGGGFLACGLKSSGPTVLFGTESRVEQQSGPVCLHFLFILI